MATRDSDDIQQAVEKNHGVTEAEGNGATFVVVSMNVYRDMRVIGSEEKLTASLAAIDRRMADVKAGWTGPFRDMVAELGSCDEV